MSHVPYIVDSWFYWLSITNWIIDSPVLTENIFTKQVTEGASTRVHNNNTLWNLGSREWAWPMKYKLNLVRQQWDGTGYVKLRPYKPWDQPEIMLSSEIFYWVLTKWLTDRCFKTRANQQGYGINFPCCLTSLQLRRCLLATVVCITVSNII